jgi:hypothetical protein
VNGRKRHILVDTGGLVLRAKVHTADSQDRAAVPLLLEGADDQLPASNILGGDQGYTGIGSRQSSAGVSKWLCARSEALIYAAMSRLMLRKLARN